MHDLGIPGPELEAADEARARGGNRQREDAEDVGTFRRQRVGVGKRDDEIGLSQLPSFGPGPRRRQLARIAFRRSLLHPSAQHRDLAIAQRMLIDKRPVRGVRFPRRHQAAPGYRRNLRRALFGVGVGEQAERRGAAGVMTDTTAIDEQRRDILTVGRRLRRRRRGTGEEDDETRWRRASKKDPGPEGLRHDDVETYSSKHFPRVQRARR